MTTKDEHTIYLLETKNRISYVDFMKPAKFCASHQAIVGTVLKEIKEDLTVHPHFIRFGYMFFYRHLTDDEIDNGPVIFKLDGQACCM